MMCDPAVDSEQFRRDLKMYLFSGNRSLSALNMLRNRALQIEIYLLTYYMVAFRDGEAGML